LSVSAQPHAEPLLQRGDVAADRGRAEVEVRLRRREALAVDHGGEDAEQPQIGVRDACHVCLPAGSAGCNFEKFRSIVLTTVIFAELFARYQGPSEEARPCPLRG